MKRGIISAVTLIAILGVIGYAGGLFTTEVLHEEACPFCRAIRYNGRQYGFGFNRIEDVPVTNWYRQNIDEGDGLGIRHPHSWLKSRSHLQAKAHSTLVDQDLSLIPT